MDRGRLQPRPRRAKPSVRTTSADSEHRVRAGTRRALLQGRPSRSPVNFTVEAEHHPRSSAMNFTEFPRILMPVNTFEYTAKMGSAFCGYSSSECRSERPMLPGNSRPWSRGARADAARLPHFRKGGGHGVDTATPTWIDDGDRVKRVRDPRCIAVMED